MPCERAIELFCMALEGMDHAHKMGIVHRDIKPANMMLTESGSIKVMDFGIARVLGTDRLTKAGHLIGTVEYMSPEQVRGEETDARSDIYSLGILLYEMLTGRVPFTSTSEYELMRCQIEDAPTPPRAHAPHVPLQVEQAIMRSLAKKRESRIQSASEFRSLLMRKNTGAVTRPLNEPNRPGAYATQADGRVHTAPASGDTVKATRLAGDQQSAASSSEITETRIGPANAATYSQGTADNVASPQVGAPAQASFLSKLNWKHYAGAGTAALLVIVAVTFALVSGNAKPAEPPAPTPPVTEAQSPNVPPAESAPAVAPAQSTQPLPTQPAATPGVSGSQTPVVGSTPAVATGNRSRNANAAAAKTAEVPPVAQQPVPSPPPTQTQPAPTQEKVATSKPETGNKEAEKKPEEKKRGLFGKIKDALTGGDKNKNAKKP
jgi:serine/threonine-protein kinase